MYLKICLYTIISCDTLCRNKYELVYNIWYAQLQCNKIPLIVVSYMIDWHVVVKSITISYTIDCHVIVISITISCKKGEHVTIILVKVSYKIDGHVTVISITVNYEIDWHVILILLNLLQMLSYYYRECHFV